MVFGQMHLCYIMTWNDFSHRQVYLTLSTYDFNEAANAAEIEWTTLLMLFVTLGQVSSDKSTSHGQTVWALLHYFSLKRTKTWYIYRLVPIAFSNKQT